MGLDINGLALWEQIYNRGMELFVVISTALFSIEVLTCDVLALGNAVVEA